MSKGHLFGGLCVFRVFWVAKVFRVTRVLGVFRVSRVLNDLNDPSDFNNSNKLLALDRRRLGKLQI